MSAIVLNPSDVAASADFLEQFLSDQIETGDFSKGTALRDIAVNAIAAVVAFIRADIAQLRNLQSLVKVRNSTSEDEVVRDAVTEILSNLLVTPKAGGRARGYAVGHATAAVDIFIQPNTRFTYRPNIVFTTDTAELLFIPQTELTPIIDTDGLILEYIFRIPLVALSIGEQGNIEPGLFSAFDRFNPYVTRIDSVDRFSGGKGPETVEEVLLRAPTAVSVRNLINDRSIPATLNDTFDGIESVLVIGMGDPEMQRDIVPAVSPHLKFHVGGAVDIYLRTALVERTFTGAVGGSYARPDNIATIFRDSNVSFSGVVAGNILRIVGGLPSVPAEFMVIANLGDALAVSEQTAFPVVTDEASPPTTVSYTVGTIGPSYVDVLADTGGLPITTGITSRTVSTPGRLTLPGGPVMDILDVAIINPASGESAFRAISDGFLRFSNQVNTTPSQAVTPVQGLQFQTIVHNPLYAQSMLQWMDLVVGTDTNQTRFDGFLLRVRYRTLAAFESIDGFIRGPRDRIITASQLPRGHHPVVVGMELVYRLKATAIVALDDVKIAQTIVNYINTFDTASASIDVSSIIQLVKDAYPTIANIVAPRTNAPILTISYVLRAPTGDLLSYETADVVDVSAQRQISGPTLDLLSYGLSERTLRYVANTNTVRVRREGF